MVLSGIRDEITIGTSFLAEREMDIDTDPLFIRNEHRIVIDCRIA